MSGNDIKASGARARRQVWLLAIAGSMVGCVLLGIVAVVLLEMRQSREKSERARLMGDDMLDSIVASFNAAHNAAVASLSPGAGRQGGGDGRGGAIAGSLTSMQEALASGALLLPAGQLSVAVTDIERDYLAAQAWRQDYQRSMASFGAARSATVDAIAALKSRLGAIEGSQRLKLAVALRDRATATDVSPQDAVSSVIDKFVVQSHLFESKVTLSDLEVVITSVLAEREIDNLANLRDNQLKPLMERLTALLEESRGAEEFQAAASEILGRGYKYDDNHQTIELGRGGLFREARGLLCLQHRRENLLSDCAETYDRWQHAVQDYLSKVDELVAEGASEGEASLRRAWAWIAVFALVANGFLFTVAHRIARTIDDQIHTVERVGRDLMQAQKLESIGQLAAGVAHEINSPMQYIFDNVEYLNGCTTNLFDIFNVYEMMLSDGGNATSWDQRVVAAEHAKRRLRYESLREQVPLAIEETRVGIERVIAIVRAMGAFSHPGTSEWSSFSMNDAIRSSVTITGNRWKHVAEMQLELDESLPLAYGRPAEFNQVVLNLVVNAADAVAEKYTDTCDKGVISVRSRYDGDCVVVEVEDTGGGVPDAVRDKIFEPFFTTKSLGKGTGQGLALCYNIVVATHGGTLDLETTPGEGSKFTFTAPTQEHCGDRSDAAETAEQEALLIG